MFFFPSQLEVQETIPSVASLSTSFGLKIKENEEKRQREEIQKCLQSVNRANYNGKNYTYKCKLSQDVQKMFQKKGFAVNWEHCEERGTSEMQVSWKVE